MVKDSSIKADDEPTFVKVKGLNFRDGIIEVNVLSKLRPDALHMHEASLESLSGSMIQTQNSSTSIFARQTDGLMIRLEEITRFNIFLILTTSLTN